MTVDNTMRLRAIIKQRLDACAEQEKRFEPSMFEPEGMNNWDMAHGKRTMLAEMLAEFDAVLKGRA